VAVVALSTLFTSKVYDDYHPDSHFKWVLYGASAAATLGMAYLRLEAGKHFTSDIVTGMAVGTACGLLVPALHKNKDMSTRRTSFYPALLNNGAGLTMIYKM
jgi:membrane-associated phospholipid phosphatase